MSDNTDSKRRQNPPNPFVSFKQFADSQFSLLMNRAFGANPFVLSPSVSWEAFKKDYERWLQQSREYERSFQRESEATSSAESPDLQEHDTRWRCPYKRPATKDLSFQEAKDLSSFLDVDSEKIDSATASNNDSAHNPSTDVLSERLAIPLSYLVASPYSPMNLPFQTPELIDKGPNLRAAFEDLIYLQNGIPLAENPPSSSASDMFPSEWLKAMICSAAVEKEKIQRQSLRAHSDLGSSSLQRPHTSSATCLEETDSQADTPDIADCVSETLAQFISCGLMGRLMTARGNLEESRRRNGSRFLGEANSEEKCYDDEDENEDEAEDHEEFEDDEDEFDDDDGGDSVPTELDLIRCAVDKAKANCSRIAAKKKERAEVVSGKEPDTPSILSTLTTTQKTSLPDGTIHTKVVLKKRFADGREESTETQHTENARLERLAESIPPKVHNEIEGKDARTRRAWFWNT